MAIPTPRLIFACAIPAIIVILSYIWFKRKKELEEQENLDRIAEKSLRYHPQEITYQRAPESDFQQLPTEDSKASSKMVIETTADKEDTCLEKRGEECEEYEHTVTDSPMSGCGMYREVNQDIPSPPIRQKSRPGEENNFQIPGATDSELEEVVEDVASLNSSQTLQSSVSCDHQLLILAEIVADSMRQISMHETNPEDNIQVVGDESLCVDNSNDSAILECTQECEIAPGDDSHDLEPTLQEGHQVLKPIPPEESPYSPISEGSLDVGDTSSDDSQDSLDVESLAVVQHIDSDDSQCSLDVVGTPNTTHLSLNDSQQSVDVVGTPNTTHLSLNDSQQSVDVVGTPNTTQFSLNDSQQSVDVEDVSDVKDTSLEDIAVVKDTSLVDIAVVKDPSLEDISIVKDAASERSPIVKPNLSDENMSIVPLTPPSSPKMTDTLLTASPAVVPTTSKYSSDVAVTPKSSKEIVSTPIKDSPDMGSTPPTSSPDTVTPSNCSPDALTTPPESSADLMSSSPKSTLDIVSAPPKSSPNRVPTLLDSSPDRVPTILESSPDIVSNHLQDTPDTRSIPLEESQHPQAMDSAEAGDVEIAALRDSRRSPAAKSGHSVSLPSSPDVASTFTARSQDVELALGAEDHAEEVGSDTCNSSTLTVTLTEMGGSPTEATPSWSMGGGDVGSLAVCGPLSVPDFSIACSDQLELEPIDRCAVPSPSLPADEAELHKLVNCNSLSAYGSSSHSPADELIESPTTSNYSDLHSEGSSDSGKGGSDIITPSVEGSNSNLLPYTAMQVYEFEIPQGLCGRLIGVRGRYVNLIKSKSRANISIKRHPFNSELKICAVIGTEEDINLALGLIRKRFPVSKFPVINLLQVNTPLINGLPIVETLQLHLPDSVTCDVILSSLVTAGHFFVQQPTHPTYPSLSRLDHFMLQCYQNGCSAPELPRPVEAGVICAASTMGGWYRAQIVYVYPDSNDCEVKFVDYGGYLRESISTLRQIRSDFMSLPFQASECFLANVTPVDEDQGWSLDAISCFEELAQGQILQAQIVSYSDDGIPYVHLYRIQGVTTTFINRQLVTSGHAKWVETQTV